MNTEIAAPHGVTLKVIVHFLFFCELLSGGWSEFKEKIQKNFSQSLFEYSLTNQINWCVHEIYGNILAMQTSDSTISLLQSIN